MPRFAIKIDLSTLFEDERKLVLVLVDLTWENVARLQRHVETLFQVGCELRFLTEDGCFLPPQEPIEIIKNIKQLKAFIPSKNLLQLRKTLTYTTTKEPEPVQKKRKHFALTSSTPYIPSKRCKSKNNEKVYDNQPHPNPPQLQVDEIELEQGVDEPKTSTNLSTQCTSVNRKVEEGSTSELISNSKKKRRRQKKHKDSTETKVNSDNDEPEREQSAAQQGSSSIMMIDTQIGGRQKHIFYTDENDATNASLLASKFIFRCKLNDVDPPERARIFVGKASIKQSEPIQKPTLSCVTNLVAPPAPEPNVAIPEITPAAPEQAKQSIEIIENILLTPIDTGNQLNGETKETTVEHEQKDEDSIATTVQDTHLESIEITDIHENENEVIKDDVATNTSIVVEDEVDSNTQIIDDDDDDSEPEVSEVIDLSDADGKEDSMLTIAKVLPFSVNLNEMPDVGDTVLFKVILSNNMLSKYICGKCDYINKRTKQLKLRVLDGFMELRSIPSKFIYNADESMNVQHIQVRMSDMVKPKLFRTN